MWLLMYTKTSDFASDTEFGAVTRSTNGKDPRGISMVVHTQLFHFTHKKTLSRVHFAAFVRFARFVIGSFRCAPLPNGRP